VPFVVCVNCFDGVLTHDIDAVRDALALPEGIPLITCDARNPASVAQALLAVVEHTMQRTAPGALVRR
jgi:signal recognition particle receptor subunit beta